MSNQTKKVSINKKSEFENLTDILVRRRDLPAVGQTQVMKKSQSNGVIANENISKADESEDVNSEVDNYIKFTDSNNEQSSDKSVSKKSDFNLQNQVSFKSVRKRDGREVSFDQTSITQAVLKALTVTNEGGAQDAEDLSGKIYEELLHRFSLDRVLGIEDIQDVVERVLVLADYPKTAKEYILYRSARMRERETVREVPEHVKQLARESQRYFKNPLAEFVYYRTYSKWLPEDGRRETWVETVDRYMLFMRENLEDKLSNEEYVEVRESILKQDVCPSMRLLWSSGPPARRSNVAAYNCSYVAPTKPQDLGEIMYILMNGAGLGFTVEYENTEQFPRIEKQTGEKQSTHVVSDDKEGWADAFVMGVETWFKGQDVDFDYSLIRLQGARLKTMGGRASGPQPLIDLMGFTKEKMLARQGRRLRTIDLYDIICKIGDIVVSGGVRRSALISLSNLDDPIMRDAKKGQFYISEPQRGMANNSAVYEYKPSAEEFLDEWIALIRSKSGERGIFNRSTLEKQLPRRRWDKFKNQKQPGTNPCGEIILRSKQFCNLTSIVVRADDNQESIEKKMRIATILGTYQASLTNFEYLSSEWKENCEEEALLGVSITGYYDCELSRDAWMLRRMKDVSIEVNREYAPRFGINRSTCITTVKPHGNSSQLLDTASGMHPRFAHYYIRRVRISRTDPLLQMLIDQGVPYQPEVGQTKEDAHTFVLEFPIAAPKGAIVVDDISALDLLAEWKKIKENYVEHNPSVTIYVGEDEWVSVANFVLNNWEQVGGLTFLPRSGHVYKLAPYEKISEEEYERRMAQVVNVDFSELPSYEERDITEGAKEYACVGGACEV